VSPEALEPRIVLDGDWSAAEGAGVSGSWAGGYLTVTTIDLGNAPIVFEQTDRTGGGSSGDDWREIALLTTDDGDADTDALGRRSLAVHGERMIIGAPGANGGVGAAAVFKYQLGSGTWKFETLLTAPGGAAGDGFGWAVSIHGNTAVIGSRAGNAAWVFRDSSGWSLQATLTPTSGQDGRFGAAVATDGSIIVVGAPGEEGLDGDASATSGAVYIFSRDGNDWENVTRIDAPESARDAEFGNAVAIHSNTVVVGAWLDDDMGEASGSAFAISEDKDQWQVEAKLTPRSVAPGARFGYDVAAAGSRLVAIALGADDGSTASWAEVFKSRGDRWSSEATLALDSETDPRWRSVAFHDDRVVLGSDAAGGRAVVFREAPGDVWVHDETLAPGDEAGAASVGFAVAAHDGVVMLGGRISGDPAGEAAAWIFRAPGPGGDDSGGDRGGKGSDDSSLRWTVRSLGALPGVGAPLSDLLTWTDSKDGQTYGALATADGLVLFTRSADRSAWTARNLTAEIEGALPITGDISIFGTRGERVFVVGYAPGGELVAYRQTGGGGAGAYEWTFENITAEHLRPAGFDTPQFTRGIVSFVTKWNALNIAGLDDHGRIRAVWTTPGMDHWRADDLSASSGAPALQGRLAVFLTPWGGINLAGTDRSGSLAVTWWVPGFTHWAVSDFNALFDGPRLEADSLSAFVTPWGALNITGKDHQGDVVAYWWTPSFGKRRDDDYWRVSNLTARISGAEQPHGALHALVTPGGEMNLFGTNPLNDVIRYYWEPGDDSWHTENLTHAAVPG